jgi:hypothetical protein
MADSKISALPAASTPLAGTEVLPIVQGGITEQVSVANLTAGRAVSALSLTSTNDSALNGVSVGLGAGSVATNTIVGNGALSTNSTGANIAVVGYQAFFSSTGTRNTGLGYRAGFNNSTGTYNTFIGGPDGSFGWSAGYSTTTGSFNTALGGGALANNIGADNNSAVGYQSLFLNASGTQNAAFGNVALRASTGSNNSALGYAAGNTLTSGSNNTFIGSNAQPSAVGASNEQTFGDSSVKVWRYVGSTTVGSLPSAATVLKGARSFVTDALAPVFGATVAAGGAVFTPVYSDGTNWKVG